MTRTLPLTLALALLLPLVAAAPPVNQVENASFEDWTDAGAPEAWTIEVGDVRRSAFAADGDAAVQLRAKPNEIGGHDSIVAQTLPQSETDAPIVPGATYALTFQAAGIYNGKGDGYATVTWIGALGNVLRVDRVDVPDATGYAGFDARFQAPVSATPVDAATTAVVRFLVTGQSSDDKVNLWVDDVAFGPMTPV